MQHCIYAQPKYVLLQYNNNNISTVQLATHLSGNIISWLILYNTMSANWQHLVLSQWSIIIAVTMAMILIVSVCNKQVAVLNLVIACTCLNF